MSSAEGYDNKMNALLEYFLNAFYYITIHIVYGKTFEGEIFTFRVDNDYLLENFCSSMLVDLYIANRQGHNLWEKICDGMKTTKVYPLKYFAIYGTPMVHLNSGDYNSTEMIGHKHTNSHIVN